MFSGRLEIICLVLPQVSSLIRYQEKQKGLGMSSGGAA